MFIGVCIRGETILNKKYIIFKLGQSTQALKRFFEKNNVYFTVINTIEELNNIIIDDFDYIVKSPSISLNEFKNIRNIKIISDLELLYLLKPSLFYVTITGTNGKTSTISYLHQLLNKFNIKHYYAGNMGIPLFSVIEDLKEKDIILIEASSYMLESTYYFKPNIYTISNLSLNHLDHHLTKELYFNAKLQIIDRLKEDDVLIFGSKMRLKSDNLRKLIELNDYDLNEYASFDKINIKVAVTNLFYIFKYLNYPFSFEGIIKNVKALTKEDFRYQTIYKDQNLKIINDSKSTNPYSGYYAVKEVLKEKADVYLIMGGKNNNQDYGVVYPLLNDLKFIYLFGENKDILFNEIIKYNKNVIKRNTLDEIIRLITYKNGIILFSPMSQSLDQYKDFMERGNHFNKLVIKILYN